MNNYFNILINLLLFFFPFKIRRFFLSRIFGYKIDPSAKIGYSMILASSLEMAKNTHIGHLTMCKGIILKMEENSRIGNLNWITGFPLHHGNHFSHVKNRNPLLHLGKDSAITHRHYIDCTDSIIIGDYTTIAGVHTQFWTHSINIEESIQDCKSIKIGSYCLIGSGCIILPGAILPDYCILGADSLLNKAYHENYILYGGVPARVVKKIPTFFNYFTRKSGFID